MDLQLASFNDLDQISRIEKDTNEYPWSSSNFENLTQIIHGLVSTYPTYENM